MPVPNVNCKIAFVENEETLAKSPRLIEKYGAKRKFYSCNQTQDYLTYVDTGSKQKLDYVAYSGDREKSSGVFGKNGLLTFKYSPCYYRACPRICRQSAHRSDSQKR